MTAFVAMDTKEATFQNSASKIVAKLPFDEAWNRALSLLPAGEMAGILADQNRGLAWTSPTGFVVVHENREPKTVRIVTTDQTFKLYEYDEERKPIIFLKLRQ